MSGILDGLDMVYDPNGRVDDPRYGPWLLKSDVREALRSEATRTLLWTVVEDVLAEVDDDCRGGDCSERIVAGVVTALAGGDQ